MEPANLNSSAPDDTQLEALLRQRAAPLPDDGFSMRVVAALPPRNATTPTSAPAKDPQRTRMFVFFAGGVCGAAVAVLGLTLKQGSGADLIETVTALQQNLAVFADTRVALALGVAAVSLLYVFWPLGRKRILFF